MRLSVFAVWISVQVKHLLQRRHRSHPCRRSFKLKVLRPVLSVVISTRTSYTEAELSVECRDEGVDKTG